MNLLLRLILVMLRARFGAVHAPVTAPSNLRFRVWITDQDMFMHMTNSRYLSFSDLGRMNLFIRSGLRRSMRQRGWRTEICGQTMTINRMLKAPKPFTVETQIHGWDDKFIVVGQRFMRNGKNHAGVVTLLAMQDQDGERLPPQDLIDLIEPGLASPKLSAAFVDLIDNTVASRDAANK